MMAFIKNYHKFGMSVEKNMARNNEKLVIFDWMTLCLKFCFGEAVQCRVPQMLFISQLKGRIGSLHPGPNF